VQRLASADSIVVLHYPAENSLVRKQREAASMGWLKNRAVKAVGGVKTKSLEETFMCPLENYF